MLETVYYGIYELYERHFLRMFYLRVSDSKKTRRGVGVGVGVGVGE